MIDYKIKKILIKAKRKIYSEILGNNPSLFKGEGFDFVQLREYEYGDDVKKIDWLISAKLQKLIIKEFREEKKLNIVFSFLSDGNMYFGTKKPKYEVAAEAGALIGFSALKNKDSFSSLIVSDKIESFLKPSNSIYSIKKLVENIFNQQYIGKKGSFELLQEKIFKLKRKSLVFVASDFLSSFNFSLISKKHEIVALIIRDYFEENPQELGVVTFADSVSGVSYTLNFDKEVARKYKAKIKKIDRKIFEHFRKEGVSFVKINTFENPYLKLLKLFGKR
jgi:uncharacterized protein (DUF58 family)